MSKSLGLRRPQDIYATVAVGQVGWKAGFDPLADIARGCQHHCMFRRALLLLWLLVPLGSAQASPPPGPPPGVLRIASEITRAFNSRNIVLYDKLFAPKLKVYFDGQLVAKDKSAWMSRVSEEFRTRLQHSSVLNVGVGADSVLIFEMRSDNPKGGTMEGIATPQASAYRIEGGRIVEARFLARASYLLPRVSNVR
jgi:hypothetical protein